MNVIALRNDGAQLVRTQDNQGYVLFTNGQRGPEHDIVSILMRGDWMEPGEPVAESSATLSLPRSIAWHLERLTDAEAARFCEEAGLAPLTAGEFREQWTGSTWDDLAMLIYIRREDEPDGE